MPARPALFLLGFSGLASALCLTRVANIPGTTCNPPTLLTFGSFNHCCCELLRHSTAAIALGKETMSRSPKPNRPRRASMNRLLVSAIVVGSLVLSAQSESLPEHRKWEAPPPPPLDGKPRSGPSTPSKREPSSDDWEGQIPLVVTNSCEGTIWPGIATQSGKGPGTGGFELESGDTKRLWVSPDWQGRVWGRTNCTVDGDSCACKTGDCFSKLDCEFSVSLIHVCAWATTKEITGCDTCNAGRVQPCWW